MTHPRYAIGQNKKLGTKAKLESSQQANEFILGRIAYGSLRINNAEKACCGPATAAATTRATETRNEKAKVEEWRLHTPTSSPLRGYGTIDKLRKDLGN